MLLCFCHAPLKLLRFYLFIYYIFFFWLNKYFIAQPKTGKIQKDSGLDPYLSKAFTTDKGRMEMETGPNQDTKAVHWAGR